MKRAQLCADSSETTHYVILASLYEKIGDNATAAMYYRKCVEICQKQGKHLGDYAKSAVSAGRYEVELATARLPGAPRAPGGEEPDLNRAKMLLEPVALSNVEEAAQAQELMRRLRQWLM